VQAELSELLSAWELDPVDAVVPLSSGANNANWLIHSRRGDFVLRQYRNLDAHQHLPFEQTLLSLLVQAPLSFAIPSPVPTRDGETVVDAPSGPAALARLIPGHHPTRGNLPHTRLGGEALGELDAAMAALPTPASDWGFTAYGDLSQVHPAITGPDDLGGLVSFAAQERAAYEALVSAAEEPWVGLREALPFQLIHADYAPSNMLVQGSRAAGLLDFEFAGPELRAMDFAIGLYQFCLYRALEDSPIKLWACAHAFAEGYATQVELSEAECAALPVLLRRSRLVGLLHWAGRLRVGLSADRDLRARVENALALHAWLARNADELVQRLIADSRRTSESR
jgi:homoserine kinase type II